MPRFELGTIVATPGALGDIPQDEIARALGRHHSGDWGDLCEQDKQENETSLREGYRLMSAYKASDGTKFWIITEADRSVTTVLLPEEY
jgi:hypothetical protein